MNRNLSAQVWALSGIILANFIAQVFYFLHLYYTPQHPFPDLRSSLALGSVFILFLLGLVLSAYQRKSGYNLLALFLSMDFMFYLWNIAGGVWHGPGLFFHLGDRDPILWTVFAIGYLNFFASGYFLFLLFSHRQQMVGAQS